LADNSNSTVPYYKSQLYRDKNWAPDQMPIASVKALGKAAKLAFDKGILSPDVVKMMLANLMVEGRTGDFGVNGVELKKNSKVSSQLDIESFFGQRNLSKYHKQAIPIGNTDTPGDMLSQGDLEYNAKLVVAALAQKQSTATARGTPDASSVFQLWNGTGPDSERHIQRVKEADRMLKTDPGNAKINKLWEDMLGILPDGPIDSTSSQATSSLLNTMIQSYDESK